MGQFSSSFHQVIPDHGVSQKSGKFLAVIHLNNVALNTKLFTKHLRTQPNKQIDKNPPGKLSKIRLTYPFELIPDSSLICRHDI